MRWFLVWGLLAYICAALSMLFGYAYLLVCCCTDPEPKPVSEDKEDMYRAANGIDDVPGNAVADSETPHGPDGVYYPTPAGIDDMPANQN